jgi:hypothetical protein
VERSIRKGTRRVAVVVLVSLLAVVGLAAPAWAVQYPSEYVAMGYHDGIYY